MQAVILAAGRGTRMGDLTEAVPKPMLQVAGKTLLEYKLDMLPESVDEVIIIVGYLGGVIQKTLGGEYNGKRILYVEQDVLDGTAGALWRARDILHDQFIVMMGDDLYSTEDVDLCLSKDGAWTMLVQETDDMHGGAVQVGEDGSITAIKENGTGHGFVGTNFFALDMRVFDAELIPKSEGSDEYGLPQTVVAASKKMDIPFYAIPASFWVQITSPEDLTRAADILKARG